ncbi:deoxyribonuclease-1-like 2 [Dermochelys coriacea]|uniref:deoxyribonuclease-1-like 2 n=1 Tax=Dermochelys coriacea TaxID=27794 RepID=UPI001CA8D820|nr:deoxyribonuclease-1-like 2 [Dermochelys coriacea]
MGATRLALALLSLAYLLCTAATLRICAFNIKNFGESKLSDKTTTGIIMKVSAPGCLGLRLGRGKVARGAKRGRNIKAPQGPLPRQRFNVAASSPSAARPVWTLQAGPPMGEAKGAGTLNRCRGSALMWAGSSPNSKVQEFVLVPLHTPPSEAVAEIDVLYDVYLDVIDKWGTDVSRKYLIFLGDFNADSSNVKEGDWGSIRLRTSEVFEWLILDSADTTVGKSDCAYKRLVLSCSGIVVCGPKLKKSIKPKSADVYDFQHAFKLEEAEALAVSDHFPVEVTLKAH